MSALKSLLYAQLQQSHAALQQRRVPHPNHPNPAKHVLLHVPAFPHPSLLLRGVSRPTQGTPNGPLPNCDPLLIGSMHGQHLQPCDLLHDALHGRRDLLHLTQPIGSSASHAHPAHHPHGWTLAQAIASIPQDGSAVADVMPPHLAHLLPKHEIHPNATNHLRVKPTSDPVSAMVAGVAHHRCRPNQSGSCAAPKRQVQTRGGSAE